MICARGLDRGLPFGICDMAGGSGDFEFLPFDLMIWQYYTVWTVARSAGEVFGGKDSGIGGLSSHGSFASCLSSDGSVGGVAVEATRDVTDGEDVDLDDLLRCCLKKVSALDGQSGSWTRPLNNRGRVSKVESLSWCMMTASIAFPEGCY
jgi:hypothetical protein